MAAERISLHTLPSCTDNVPTTTTGHISPPDAPRSPSPTWCPLFSAHHLRTAYILHMKPIYATPHFTCGSPLTARRNSRIVMAPLTARHSPPATDAFTNNLPLPTQPNARSPTHSPPLTTAHFSPLTTHRAPLTVAERKPHAVITLVGSRRRVDQITAELADILP